MDNLDLDINNYTIKDIESFFRFKPDFKYTAENVELREYELREQLLKSGHVNKRFKRDLIDFMDRAKQWLIIAKCEPKKEPTSIPKDYQLDKLNTPLSKSYVSRSEEYIDKQKTQFIYSQNSEFFPGIINPLDTRIITKCLNIDTRFRDNIYSTQSSDFTINLPTKLNKVVSMQLAGIELPVSFYGISSQYNNNYLYISVNHTSFADSTLMVDSSMIVIVPDGNYNASDFISSINLSLCPVNIDSSPVNATSIFSYIKIFLDITVLGSGTGKITIKPNGTYANYVNTITLDFRRDINGDIDTYPISNRIGYNLGLLNPLYEGSSIYTAESLLDPARIRYLFLVIDDFNNNNNHFISVFNKSILSPNILARLSIRGSYFSLIMESDFSILSEPRKYFGPVDIQKLKVQLIDEYGRIIQMNSANFSFCLNLKMIYDL